MSSSVSRLLGCLLFTFLMPALLGAGDARTVLRQEAAQCARAWERKDVNAITSSLPPRWVTRFGGRAALVRELKTRFAQASSLGVDKWQVQIDKVPVARTTGTWQTALLPVTVVAHGPHLDVTQQSHVLALSADQGKHWYFFPLYQVTQKEFENWFPEFAGKIVVPADPDPRMEVVF